MLNEQLDIQDPIWTNRTKPWGSNQYSSLSFPSQYPHGKWREIKCVSFLLRHALEVQTWRHIYSESMLWPPVSKVSSAVAPWARLKPLLSALWSALFIVKQRSRLQFIVSYFILVIISQFLQNICILFVVNNVKQNKVYRWKNLQDTIFCCFYVCFIGYYLQRQFAIFKNRLLSACYRVNYTLYSLPP